MRLVNQSVEEVTVVAPNKQATLCEQVYRVSHLSESKGGDPVSFIDKMIKMKHLAGLEFWSVYLLIDEPELRKNNGTFTETKRILDIFKSNPHTRVAYIEKQKRWAVSTNMRVLYENNLAETSWASKYICFPTQYHTLRRTFKITGCHQDYIDMRTHRAFSWLVESTRFCNYSKGKFGSQLTYIDPWHIKKSRGLLAYRKTLVSLWLMEKLYKFIGGPAQECSAALSRLTKADFYMCGFEDDFDHFFELRADGVTGHAHPLVREIAQKIKSFIKN